MEGEWVENHWLKSEGTDEGHQIDTVMTSSLKPYVHLNKLICHIRDGVVEYIKSIFRIFESEHIPEQLAF